MAWRKKNVIIIQNTSLAAHYGLSTYLRNIVVNLASDPGLSVTVVCNASETNMSVCPSGVRLIEVEGSPYSVKDNAIFFIRSFWALVKMHRKGTGVDVIHCLYPSSSLAAAALFKLASRRRTRIVYDLRSPWVEIGVARGSIGLRSANVYKRIAYLSERELSRFADVMIFITDGLKGFYRNKLHMAGKPVSVIPSGIDSQFFMQPPTADIRAIHGIAREEVLLGYVGTLSSMRELGFVIEAFAEARRSRPELRLLMAGEGDAAARLKELAARAGVGGNVVFTGKLSFEQARNCVSAFDAGICHLPDTFIFRQSYPMKVLEYLAAGLPVFASGIQAHRDIRATFPQVQLYSTKEQLERLMLNLRKRKEVPEGIHNYDWSVIASSIAQVY